MGRLYDKGTYLQNEEEAYHEIDYKKEVSNICRNCSFCNVESSHTFRCTKFGRFVYSNSKRDCFKIRKELI